MDVYANVLLKDNKIVFWRVGRLKHSADEFHKDFWYAGLRDEFDNNLSDYVLISQKMEHDGNKGFDEAEEWMKQWELCDDYKGVKPY